jgi:LacI family transcriptional regulator
MVTLQDIADEAGVSKMTVSNVVNGNLSKVSRKKLTQINAILRKHQYVPNHSARSLSAKSSRIIAGIISGCLDTDLLIDGYNGQFFGAVMYHVQQRGYYFMLQGVNDYHEVTALLQSWNMDGAVFVGMANADIKKTLSFNRIPLVFTDSYSDVREIVNIGVDDRKGGRLAAECILRHGHRRPGFICFTTEDDESLMHQRLRGYRETLAAAGVQLKDEHIHHIRVDGITAISAIAAAYAPARAEDLPSAWFTTSDRLALYLIRAFHERGIRVPEDVSVIGFDNLAAASSSIPALTTIAQDTRQKAQLAVADLFRRIENPAAPMESVVLDVSLVERESVGPVPGI